jgi:hypothetical protein
MPIIYIHGVNTRSRDGFLNEIQVYLRRYIAPVISAQPATVSIEDVYWGDLGAKFAWYGASRPKSRLLGQGADAQAEVAPIERALMAELLSKRTEQWPQSGAGQPSSGGLISGGAAPVPAGTRKIDLSALSSAALSDLVGGIIDSTVPIAKERVSYRMAADDAAHDPVVLEKLRREQDPEKQLEELLNATELRVRQRDPLLGQGAGEWLAKIGDRSRETIRRAQSFPAYTASIFAAEARKPINELVSFFLGDVLEYIKNRGEKLQPGPIPKLLVEKLKAAQQNKERRQGEPLIVLSHSMGGQIVYDTISHFLPNDPSLAQVRVDFWCASASQVGFFEEAKLFLASSNRNLPGHPVPFPRTHLGVWWNVWDQNDFISFTTRDIFERVDDEEFDSGMSLINAHSGYLQRPSFFRRFAEKLEGAKNSGWRTN